VVINPDAGQSGGCLAVAWARLSFLAISPVILVHGNGSNGAFFVRRGFAPALDAAGLPEDSSINLAVGTGGTAAIAANVTELQTLIPNIVKSFGVNSVHIVAHSKGGLDTRSWLSSFSTTNAAGTATNPPFRVISLTTLSTPHRGSALADLEIAVDATSVGLFGLTVANLKSLGLGTPDTVDLTTFSNASFNPPLPSGADYRMLGADGDLNGNGMIQSAPVDEYLAARGENGTLAGIFASPPIVIGGLTITGPQIADALVTTAYQILFNVSSVTVTKIAIPLPLPPFPPIPGLEFVPPLSLLRRQCPLPYRGQRRPTTSS
jgi:pimeloyl-ACP methyl ester carboxylesterase